MKKKDIERCEYINLSTPPEKMMETMELELPSVKYFLRKSFGGTRQAKKQENALLDSALAIKEDITTEIVDYISPKGNRWVTYKHIYYSPQARCAQCFNSAFIYYETYGSCGAFTPLYNIMDAFPGKPDDALVGVITFTSHFFLRFAERTGKLYRSRELIQEFANREVLSNMFTANDGEVMMKFTGGYGFGVRKSEDPIVVEIRTYLNDSQLSPSQRKKVEKLDAFSVISGEGIANKQMQKSMMMTATNEELEELAERKVQASQKLGIDSRYWDILYLQLVIEIEYLHAVGYDPGEWPEKQGRAVQATTAEYLHASAIEIYDRWIKNHAEPDEEEIANVMTRHIIEGIKKAGLVAEPDTMHRVAEKTMSKIIEIINK